jgi:hypothetical protein
MLLMINSEAMALSAISNHPITICKTFAPNEFIHTSPALPIPRPNMLRATRNGKCQVQFLTPTRRPREGRREDTIVQQQQRRAYEKKEQLNNVKVRLASQLIW